MAKKAVISIKKYLDNNNIQYKEYSHKPVRTSEEAQAVRPEYTLSQGAKAIIIKAKLKSDDDRRIDKDYCYFMFVLPADKRLDSKKVKRILNAKNISFASADEVIRVTDGIHPGGVHPFGNLFGIEVFVDPSLSENEEIIFNAGDRSISIAIKYVDYERLLIPTLTEFIQT